MPVQFKKRTHGDKRRRASHFALDSKNILVCEKCKQPRLPHHACSACGYYKGKSIVKKSAVSPKKRSVTKKDKKIKT